MGKMGKMQEGKIKIKWKKSPKLGENHKKNILIKEKGKN